MHFTGRLREKHKQAQAIQRQLKKTGASNAATYNGALGIEQMSWLKNRLKIAYAVVEVNNQQLKITGNGMEPSRTLLT